MRRRLPPQGSKYLIKSDGAQPGFETGFVPELAELTKCQEHRLLDNVLRFRLALQPPPSELAQRAYVRAYQIRKRIATASQGAVDQLCFC